MIRLLIDIYVVVVILDAILSYLPQFKHHPAVITIKRIADVSLKPVRRYLPQDLPFDLAPVVVVMLLNLIKVLW